MRPAKWIVFLLMLAASGLKAGWSQSLRLEGVMITPHIQSDEMRYRKETDFSLGARTQLFIRNTSDKPVTVRSDREIRLRGKTPDELLAADEWAWHDFPSAWENQTIELPPGAMTVWSWNGKREEWGAGARADMTIQESGGESPMEFNVSIDAPDAWLSSATFLGEEKNPHPNRLVFHIANQRDEALRLESCRLWLPEKNSTWRILLAQEWLSDVHTFPSDGIIPAGDRGGAFVITGRLPLTYAVLEVRLRDEENHLFALWGRLRIKREAFDISGGWVSSNIDGRSSLTFEPYLQTLRRMHINTGHIGEVGGYTDLPDLYERYPLKLFNKLADFSRYDKEAALPRIHAVEFLGEPQYGGGRPVPPMEVWRRLAPYCATQLPTTVTHSEERIWRFYAGLSDYPHYDAYRVCAPSPDSWRLYERWGEERIRWGAPIETIGAMTRSLRELNRPAPIACWSQGAHQGWDRYGGRERTSPTPAELRAQAYHALAARITSLYWFNLSLKSLLKFPDLIEPITRVGREIRMLEDFYLEGDAFHYERLTRDGKPDWDLSVIAGPRGALLFALDLTYQPDREEKIFRFGPAREAVLTFPLPAYLQEPVQALKADADGVSSVPFEITDEGVKIQGVFEDVNVFAASVDANLKDELEARRGRLAAYEDAFGFDPGNNENDLKRLRAIVEKN